MASTNDDSRRPGPAGEGRSYEDLVREQAMLMGKQRDARLLFWKSDDTPRVKPYQKKHGRTVRFDDNTRGGYLCTFLAQSFFLAAFLIFAIFAGALFFMPCPISEDPSSEDSPEEAKSKCGLTIRLVAAFKIAFMAAQVLTVLIIIRATRIIRLIIRGIKALQRMEDEALMEEILIQRAAEEGL